MSGATAAHIDSSPADSAAAAPVATAAQRKPRYQPRKFPLSMQPRQMPLTKTLADRCLDVIAPWHIDEYPGRTRAWIYTAGHLPWKLNAYRQGRSHLDIATIDRLLAAVESRAIAAAAVVSELKAERDRIAALPPKRYGFAAVTNGTDKRYRGRKTRKISKDA